MENNSLVVQGKPLVLPDYGHAVSKTFSLVGARRYVAANAGLSDTEIAEKTMKEVKDLAIANGATEDEIKSWRKEYDATEAQYRKFSRAATALFSSDPAYKQTWKPSFNKKGAFIGAVTTFRKEKSLNQSANSRLQLAEARVAELEAMIANRLPAIQSA